MLLHFYSSEKTHQVFLIYFGKTRSLLFKRWQTLSLLRGMLSWNIISVAYFSAKDISISWDLEHNSKKSFFWQKWKKNISTLDRGEIQVKFFFQKFYCKCGQKLYQQKYCDTKHKLVWKKKNKYLFDKGIRKRSNVC